MRYFTMHIKYIDGNTASGIQSVASERTHGAAVATLKPFNAQQKVFLARGLTFGKILES